MLLAGCAWDHVHTVVMLSPTVTLADLVQRMKGASAHDVNAARMLNARLRWQHGYWAESVGPGDVSPLVRYLRMQRPHHDDSHPAEAWQRDAESEPAEGGL
jgi:REP element-mobilizing transposase RayT